MAYFFPHHPFVPPGDRQPQNTYRRRPGGDIHHRYVPGFTSVPPPKAHYLRPPPSFGYICKKKMCKGGRGCMCHLSFASPPMMASPAYYCQPTKAKKAKAPQTMACYPSKPPKFLTPTVNYYPSLAKFPMGMICRPSPASDDGNDDDDDEDESEAPSAPKGQFRVIDSPKLDIRLVHTSWGCNPDIGTLSKKKHSLKHMVLPGNALKIPTHATVKELYEAFGLGGDQVLQELVERGGGRFDPGFSIIPRVTNGKMTVGDAPWVRGYGLKTAAGEPIYVHARQRRADDEN